MTGSRSYAGTVCRCGSIDPHRKPSDLIFERMREEWSGREDLNLRLLVRNQAGLSSSTRIERTALKLAQFNNLSLNFVTFRKHSAQKLSKTIWTDPSGVLNVNELKRENVLIRASHYALPISHRKWPIVSGHKKTPKPRSVFGADFAVHYRRYALRLSAF